VFLLNPLVFKQTHVKAHSNVRLTPALQGSSPCHLPEPFAYDLFDCKRRRGKKYPQLALSQKADKKTKRENTHFIAAASLLVVSTLRRNIG